MSSPNRGDYKLEVKAQPVPEQPQAEVESQGCCERVVNGLLVTLGFILALIPCFWCSACKVFAPYERGVQWRLGKLQKPAKGPGLRFFLPCVDTVRRTDLRTRTLVIPPQQTMSKESVTCTVDAIILYHVFDPILASTAVESWYQAVFALSATTLRAVIGESELDELLQKREMINRKMKMLLAAVTEQWGVRVTSAEVKEVIVPPNMQRAMASQAEAERERRAKIISAEGELQASKAILSASIELSKCPAAMQLRYLQTLTQIGQDQNTTVVFPLPMDLLSLANRVPAMSLYANPPPPVPAIKAPEYSPAGNTTASGTESATIAVIDSSLPPLPSAPPAHPAASASASASAAAAAPNSHPHPHPQPPGFGGAQIPAALLSALASSMTRGGHGLEGMPQLQSFLSPLPNQPHSGAPDSNAKTNA